MDILLTCVCYSLLIGCLAYILLSERGKSVRKKNIVAEVHYGFWTALVSWTIGFAFITLFTCGYYIRFFSDAFDLLHYFITITVFLPLFAIAYYLERWRITIDGENVIKYGLFLKKTFHISDLIEVKQTWFGYKFYLKNKKAFGVDARYHDFSRSSINDLKEKVRR